MVMSLTRRNTYLSLIVLSSYLWGFEVLCGCLTAHRPYENHQGWTIFPFTNSCSEDATASLCVKSWPPGSSDPAYNSYGGVVPANESLEITNGMWRTYDSYRWQENAPQTCPFE
jgi:hypothetical protein